MTDRYRLLISVDELDRVVAGSFARPVLFFKHSLTCGTSAWAHEELDALLDGPPIPIDVCVVHVQTGRALSNAIAERFGVRHQSPQALLVHNGEVVWHASHHGVTQAAMASALQLHVGLPIAP
jgi:bacillithiol system protein YtxJ